MTTKAEALGYDPGRMTQGMARLLKDYGDAERVLGRYSGMVAAEEADGAYRKLRSAIVSLESRNTFLEDENNRLTKIMLG